MDVKARMEAHPVLARRPEGFSLSEVEVRLATREERLVWDALMDARHYLGFRRFAAHAGLRYVAEWRGQWLALAGWQGGAYRLGEEDARRHVPAGGAGVRDEGKSGDGVGRRVASRTA